MYGSLTKILIDTNIVIHLEDYKEVQQEYSDLMRLCSKHSLSVFIHESSYDDIKRDKDQNRRRVSLSKLEKYNQVKSTPYRHSDYEQYGSIKSDNDRADFAQLVSLDLGVVDILITEDRGMHKRVIGTELEDKVLNIRQALSLVKDLYEPNTVSYLNVAAKTCNQLDLKSDFFQSLMEDYSEFSGWITKRAQEQRPCWVIENGEELAGLIIYKDEMRSNAKDCSELDQYQIPGDKVLKVCLFKISPYVAGNRYGEQLLKTAMDFGYRNTYDSMYLSVFPKHKSLVSLIEKFGFIRAGSNARGEDYYYKPCKPDNLLKASLFDFHKRFWPAFSAIGTDIFVIPIIPTYVDRLFPENKITPVTLPGVFSDPVIPGNAIRKVYISNSQTKLIEPGSIILFYATQYSQVFAVGICEEYSEFNSIEELKSFVGNRSVYKDSELLDRLNRGSVKALNFYYSCLLDRPLGLKFLMEKGVLKAQPQSTMVISDDGKPRLLDLLSRDFNVPMCHSAVS